MSRSTHSNTLTGWREWVSLPDLGVDWIKAKIDTGARSSALHVEAQWTFVDGGAPWVGFRVRTGLHDGGPVEARAPVHDTRRVTDSGGHRTERVFIATLLELGGVQREMK